MGEDMEMISTALINMVETASKKLEELSEDEASIPPSPAEWSKKEIVGHLIDSASNNHQRFIRALQEDELVFPAYQQEEWVGLQAYSSTSWKALVSFWRLYNLHMAHIMRQIPATKSDTICRVGTNEPVTLGYLVEDYLVHMKTHLKQLGL